MINSVNPGIYISVEGAYNPSPTFYNTIGKDLVGQVKYNSNSKNLEVWDGGTWMPLVGSNPTVSLVPVAQRAIDWIIEKMNQEEKMSMHTHPAMKAAYENFQRARQQLEATAILVEEEYNNEKTTT